MTSAGKTTPESANTRSKGWDAFLSYSSRDALSVGRVQRFLERYRLPDGRKLRVYRDETDISGGELPAQLRAALADSGCLLVCCSEAAAQSNWVKREIEEFRRQLPDRPILPLLITDEPPANIPSPLTSLELRWADLRKGWRCGFPRRDTRVELIRVVATAAGIDFRKLLPLDRQRRRRNFFRFAAALLLIGFAAAWAPVESWRDVTPEGPAVVGCDTLDDGIAAYQMNEPQAVKNIVQVQRNLFSTTPSTEVLNDRLVPRGRLLPARVAGRLGGNCRGSSGWIGEPQPGTCIKVTESAETVPFEDPMGGGDISLSKVRVNGLERTLEVFWKSIDYSHWRDYGRTSHPSDGLPVFASENNLWLGFPDNEFSRGTLWHSADSGRSWRAETSISDVRSLRQTEQGVLIAARLNRELGFYLQQSDRFEPFEVPGKGDQLEVCGEIEGFPVIRVDRKIYRFAQQPWWQSQLSGN